MVLTKAFFLVMFFSIHTRAVNRLFDTVITYQSFFFFNAEMVPVVFIRKEKNMRNDYTPLPSLQYRHETYSSLRI